MSQADCAFAALVHRVLVSERKWSVEQVAQDMGMSYEMLYARLVGRTAFKPAEIGALLRAAPDKRFVRQLLAYTIFLAVDRTPFDGLPEEKSLERGGIRAVIESAGVMEAIEEALRDNKVDHVDRLRVADEIDDAEAALAGLRARLQE
ncbi:MAG: phage regulatory CII family protein [Thalassobaculaceae bacterium]